MLDLPTTTPLSSGAKSSLVTFATAETASTPLAAPTFRDFLRKYYAEDYNVDDKSVSKEDVAKIDNLRKKYFAAGVRSVPFIVNKSDLK